MRKIILSEAQFVSLFNKPGNGNFYQDGEFAVTNDRMNALRGEMYPFYKSHYNEDKDKIIHQLARVKVMRMIDNGEKLPEFGDPKIYKTVYNNTFSRRQVEYVENQLRQKYENMSLEELYDEMLINQERGGYEGKVASQKAIEKLLEDGFFDSYLNGQVKDLALWTLGKLGNNNDMLVKLYSKNKFTKELNAKSFETQMKKTMDEIVNNDDAFMKNPLFLALDLLRSSIWKLSRIPK